MSIRNTISLVFCLFPLALIAQDHFYPLRTGKPRDVHEINRRLLHLTDEVLKAKIQPNEVMNANYVPVYSDSVYAMRLRKLDVQSPIKLDFKPIVRNYIEAYMVRNREKTARIHGRSELYFPLFEEYLDRYNLPLELKYLSVIESALDPKAKSRSGALGLWQFMYNASKMFDLRITSYIDERMDPARATEAACKYFQYLYRIFGDWQLAIAAYNGGPGVVRDAIQKAGGKTDFWAISPYLPDQTRKYVPAFIAANYVMNYPRQHNLIPEKVKFSYHRVDAVQVDKELSFEKVSEVLQVPIDVIRELNPIYKRDFIPESELPARFTLPVEKVGEFIDFERSVYAQKKPEKKYLELQKELSSTEGKYCIIHKVQRGEYFHKIAMKYSCTIHNIREWNKLENNKLYVGQRLKVWIFPTDTVVAKPSRETVPRKRKFLIYQVQKGDNLQIIADRFKIPSVNDIKRANGLKGDAVIKPGKLLKIVRID
ncbi:MAG: transglycosylase SLT domain-containing protein [Marinifilaceae bacterium]